MNSIHNNHLDINPDELGRNYPTKVAMQGDVRNSLRRMIAMAEKAAHRTEWVNRVQELVKNWKESVSDKVNSEIVPMRPCKSFQAPTAGRRLLLSAVGRMRVMC